MHPWHHALSSVKKFGGEPMDYWKIHHWFDASKSTYADFRHRALRHHSFGIYECEERFGVTLQNSDGTFIPIRVIGEQHVMEDCGRIPTVKDWLGTLKGERWMVKSSALTADQKIQLGKNKPIGIGSEASVIQ